MYNSIERKRKLIIFSILSLIVVALFIGITLKSGKVTAAVCPACSSHPTLQEATCESPAKCSYCGYQTGSALGHSEGAWKSSGINQHSKSCTRCYKVLATAGCQWKAATCTQPQTCTVCSQTKGTVAAHNWKNATCYAPKTCTVCSKTEGTKLEHDWKWTAASITHHIEVCRKCNTSNGSPTPCEWKPATCTEPKTCKKCGQKTGNVEHDYKWKSCGPNQHIKTCTICKQTDGASAVCQWESATCEHPERCTVCKQTKGTVADHRWKAATCYAPKTCTVCSITEGKKLEHDWKWTSASATHHIEVCRKCNISNGSPTPCEWNPATCTEPKTCKKCGQKTGNVEHDYEWKTCGPNQHIKTCTICKQTDGASAVCQWESATCEHPERCTVCKQTKGTVADHRWKAATCYAPKTCTVCSITEGTKLEHDWKWTSASATHHIEVCTKCNASNGSPTPCEWNPATCTEPQTCKVCLQTAGAELGHSYVWNRYHAGYNDFHYKSCTRCGEEDPPGVCQLEGSTSCDVEQKCDECGYVFREAQEHDWEWIPADSDGYHRKICAKCNSRSSLIRCEFKEATCSTPETCKDCGRTKGSTLEHDYKWTSAGPDQHIKTCSKCNETDGAPTGCEWKDATCTEPQTCKVCSQTTGAELGHDYKWKSSGPSQHIKTCSRCNETEGASAGCEWKDATCTEPRTCKVCSQTTGAELRHDYKWKSSGPSQHIKTCSRCNETEGAPAGCEWKDATCTEAKTCKDCGQTTGAVLGHSYTWEPLQTGLHVQVCSRCNEKDESPTVCEWKDATCEEPITCALCFQTMGKKLDHDYKWNRYDGDDGYSYDYKSCTRCDYKEKAYMCTPSQSICTEVSECIKCGYVFREAKEHEYIWKSAGPNQHIEWCKRCGYDGVSAGCQWKDATCTEPKICIICSQTTGNELGHNYIWKQLEEGKHIHICSRCNETTGEAEEHNYKWTSLGTVNHEGICSKCNIKTAPEKHTGETHSNGGKCTKCLNIYEQHEKSSTILEYKITNTQHIPVYKCTKEGCEYTHRGTREEHTIIQYTDNENGTHSDVCTKCGYTVTNEHRYEEQASTFALMRTSSKNAVARCIDCNAVKTAIEEECNHSHVEKNDETQHWEECTKCYYVKKGSLSEHEYHTYTDNGNGTHSNTCTVCKYKITDEHYYEEGKCKECGVAETTEEDECTHSYIIKNNDTQHWEECSECQFIKQGTLKAHYYEECMDNGNGTHSSTCTVCKYKTTYEHYYEDELCIDCGAKVQGEQCGHEHQIYKNNNDGTHTMKCTLCGYEVTEQHSSDCEKCEKAQDEEQKDNTIIGGIIPDAGASSFIIIGIIVLIAISVGLKAKVKKYKDI